ncbi:hypothetical protein D3Z53_02000 [Lachnospiraceae bacterium]|nr:Cas9 inhibitor AcrIIA9 family protein [uncultured Schaedlerella sp.]NBI56861.1 hypothetical protein [Lachnospiraceae bacterium]
MYEKLINNTEELNAMAVHLRNSQNFSELKVLAAQWLVPKQDVEDFIKGKRFQLAEIPLSEKEYTSAVEKLREEMWHMKDQLFTDIVGRHLMEKAEKGLLFGSQVLKKQKTLQKCMNYIMEQAYQMAEKEHDNRFGGKNNPNRRADRTHQSVGMGISETKVYQWAEEYYALDDEAKEIKEQKAERKKRLNAFKKEEERKKNADSSGKMTVKGASEGKEEKSAEKGEEKQKQEEVPATEKQEKGAEKPTEKAVQISLFDMMADQDKEKKGEKENESV